MHPRRIQSFYTRLGVPALSFIRKPTSYFSSAWEQTNSAGVGNGARYMGPVAGTAQKTITSSWTAIPSDGPTRHLLAHAQFLSDPLSQQTVASATWIVAFAQRTANAGATFQWAGVAALHVVNGRTGTRRATVFNAQMIGVQATNTDERTCYMPCTGEAFEIFAGDYFALELGVWIVNTSGAAVVPQTSVFSDGATDIVSAAALTTDPRAAVFAPVYFTTTLPEPGEPLDPSVTSADAIQLVRQALPANTFHDFDDTSSPDYQFLSFNAETLKRYGYDALDLLNRELDPRRTTLKLSDHKAVFRITQDPPSLAEQRALALARYREYGGPTSLFAVSAAVGVVLGYAIPSQLEIMEISADQLRAAIEHVPTYGGAIPEDVGFGATNFVYRTPMLHDGGAVWGAGAFLRLALDIAAGAYIHVKLTGPDGTFKIWSPITRWQEVTYHVLYGKEFAGKAIHGNWVVQIYRTPGSPAVNLTTGGGPLGPGWSLYVAGSPKAYVGPTVNPPLAPPQPVVVPSVVRDAGLGRQKFWWGVYADPAKISVTTAADFGAAQQGIDRMRHGYHKGTLILSKAPIPTDAGTPLVSGSQALPDRCVPT